MALLVIKTHWFDPLKAPTIKIIQAPLMDDRVVELEIAIDLRTVDYVEIRPVRRPLLDVEGTIKDAERLANQGKTNETNKNNDY